MNALNIFMRFRKGSWLKMLTRPGESVAAGASGASGSRQAEGQPGASPVSVEPEEFQRVSASLPSSSEFRRGIDLVRQLAIDAMTPDPAQRGQSTGYWPPASQSSQPPRDQTLNWAYTPWQNLAMYAPNWQHGDQSATPLLIEGMRSNEVLPSAFQPETCFMIGPVSYTAFLGLSGRPNDIFVRRC